MKKPIFCHIEAAFGKIQRNIASGAYAAFIKPLIRNIDVL